MNKEFIPYEQALDFKELGFDESCFAIYDKKILKSLGAMQRKNSTYPDIITAPLYQQAFRWFREKYNIFPYTYTGNGNLFHYCMFIKDRDNQYHSNDLYLSNEEAELECLKKLIEIVKKQKEYESNIIV
jgi:hypothetical protein